MSSRALYYIVTNKKRKRYIIELITSYLTMRNLDPDLKVYVITDLKYVKNLENHLNLSVILADTYARDAYKTSRYLKTNLPDYTLTEECMFVDTDTVFIRDFNGIWDYIFIRDIAFRVDTYPNTERLLNGPRNPWGLPEE